MRQELFWTSIKNYRHPTANPDKVLDVISQLAQKFSEYDKVAAGFPGLLKMVYLRLLPTWAQSMGKF